MHRLTLSVALLLSALFVSPAWAQDPGDSVADGAPTPAADDDEFDFLKPANGGAKKDTVSGDDFSMYEGDDEDFKDFALAPAPEAKPKAAPKSSAPSSDVRPLTASYKGEIVAVASDSVVVELPVLVAQGPADVAQDFWLVGEVWVQGKKVGETRQFISAQGLSQLGPTTAFLKAQAPVSGPSGSVELRVFTVVGNTAPQALFTQSVDYSL